MGAVNAVEAAVRTEAASLIIGAAGEMITYDVGIFVTPGPQEDV